MRHATPPLTVPYGPMESQVGDLYLPDTAHPPVVCLLHGGFWRTPYDRAELTNVAMHLEKSGFAVWNLEYRRIGEPGGGWPGTFEDVAAGIDHLATLAADGIDLDLDRVIVAGHSAGGQLALWAAASKPAMDLPKPSRIRPMAAAGLAAVVDLGAAFAFDSGTGTGAVAELMGGSPQQFPERFAAASPVALLPIGVPQLILHGAKDEALPVRMARDYAAAAIAAGDDVAFVELADAGHMDFLDPMSQAHAALCEWLARMLDQVRV